MKVCAVLVAISLTWCQLSSEQTDPPGLFDFCFWGDRDVHNKKFPPGKMEE
jgi:hypothetical protein